MKRLFSKKTLIIVMTVLSLSIGTLISAEAVSLKVDGSPVSMSHVIRNNTTYVPIRAMSILLYPDAEVVWENGQAVVRKSDLTITARPGDCTIEANGRMLFAGGGILAENGSVMVPVRVLAKAFGGTVDWDASSNAVVVTRGSGTIQSGDAYYNSDDLLWLSRIIQAESVGEPLMGKIAVGNVILNRVLSTEFPDTIYGVIFDSRWGGQFEPVTNGTIYNTPSAESILAAKLCLDGASAVGNSIFFLNPAISSNLWTTQNRDYITTIGSHEFYA